MNSPNPPLPRYRVAIHRTSRGYFALVRDIPGCISRGATEVEALENARAAIRAYLSVARVLALRPPCVELEISA